MNSADATFSVLKDAFSSEAVDIYFVVRDSQSLKICDDVIHSFIGSNPVIVIAFPDKDEILAIGYTQSSFEVAWIDRSIAAITEFADRLNLEDADARRLYGFDSIVGLFSVRRLVLPFDSIASVSLRLQSVVVVEDVSCGRACALAFSFCYGVKVAVLAGYYDEFVWLMNDQVEFALAQARAKMNKGQLRFQEHVYTAIESSGVDLIRRNEWF